MEAGNNPSSASYEECFGLDLCPSLGHDLYFCHNRGRNIGRWRFHEKVRLSDGGGDGLLAASASDEGIGGAPAAALTMATMLGNDVIGHEFLFVLPLTILCPKRAGVPSSMTPSSRSGGAA